VNKPAEVVIIGSGIIGAACALELATEGLRVLVIDEGFPGSGSTGAAMGHIVVMDDSEAQFAITRYSQILWDDLREQLPPAVEFDPCGTLWVAADDKELAEVRPRLAAKDGARRHQAERGQPGLASMPASLMLGVRAQIGTGTEQLVVEVGVEMLRLQVHQDVHRGHRAG